MDRLDREESEQMDRWVKQYMADHDCSYIDGFNAYKHEAKARRYQEYQAAKEDRGQIDREVFIRNYVSETGCTRGQAIRHVNAHMPNLRTYGGANIQQVSAYINNPGGNDPEMTMRLFQEFFRTESDRAKACAGEWISSVVDRLITKRAPAGDFRSKFILQYTQEVLSRNPDVAQAYESGIMSDSAIRQIFYFRFGDDPYNVSTNHA